MRNIQVDNMLNDQMARELFSSYLYLGISNYFAGENLDGFANWFEIQAQEELDHAMLFRTYLINNEVQVCLKEIRKPEDMYKNHLQALKAAHAHELSITSSINEIYAVALNEKDFRTTQFLDWFIKEQGEEEKNTSDLCMKYGLFAGDSKGLYQLNAELLARVYAAPSLVL